MWSWRPWRRGLPVVATRVGGLPEMVVPGETGWLVPPRDPAALAAAISQLLADPQTMGAFGSGRATTGGPALPPGRHGPRSRRPAGEADSREAAGEVETLTAGIPPPTAFAPGALPSLEAGRIRGDKMSEVRVAYVLLWFPEPSQTFVLNEVNTLYKLGLDLKVYTLYGPRPVDGRVSRMAPVAAPVQRMGLAATGTLLKELADLRRNWGPEAARFLARVLVRRWRSLETGGEAFWSALAGVHLARLLVADKITHIHAPWADGPATAAWVASHLTGIPFSFSARAGDIFPPDGALLEKMRAAAFIRCNNQANIGYLAGLAGGETASFAWFIMEFPSKRSRRRRPP